VPEGRGGAGSSAPAALLFVCGLAIFSLYYTVFLKGRPRFWPDTYEYAQVARNHPDFPAHPLPLGSYGRAAFLIAAGRPLA
jgi:hypothetical protein